MGECVKCKESYPEYKLTWVEVHSEYHMQIIWTGRGRPEVEKKIELLCDKCLKDSKEEK